MASDDTIRTVHVMCPPDDDDDSDYYYDAGRRMSRLSIESSDGDEADAEPSDDEKDAKGSPEDDDNSDSDKCAGFATSLPGTPDRFGGPVWVKEYASETEAGVRMRRKKGRRMRERWLDRIWEMKKSKAVEEGECRLLVRPRGQDSSGSISMDMEEVKACRDLGLQLPCDWTVEIPCGFSGVDTSSGGNSPIAPPNWRISSPGDDPKEVKARLKVWAQAVALASASGLGV